MTKKYNKPEIEISIIDLTDVIITSDEGYDTRTDSCNDVDSEPETYSNSKYW